ncbi:LPS translocon maturation chaperone LptM [Altererythrobacter sp. Z27]|uniref:LPS translocon maturation chaperone LptM n=1 Tax=Altererythrobacter sp. Z27 TaxID=3461147 RepID=UPI004043F2FE
MKKKLILAASLLLAACGQKTDLEPLANQDLPPAPYGATEQPKAEELLEIETLAAPQRSVELRRRSEERADDPFDLPPE